MRTRPGHPLHERQVNVLRHVATFVQAHGRAPTAAEVGNAIGIDSAGVRRALEALNARGLVALTMVGSPSAVLADGWRALGIEPRRVA